MHVLLNYHYLTLHAPRYFVAHLLVIYALSFLAFSSLIACVVRDPGPVPEAKSEEATQPQPQPSPPHDDSGDMSLEDALLSEPPEDYTQPGKWCRICWKPKPERAHHCSQCGRCVLKMGAYHHRANVSVTLSHFPSSANNCTARIKITIVPGWAPNVLCVCTRTAGMAARFILETIIFYSDALLCLCTAALQGFRTYPSFLHFLASVTLLAAYVAAICIRGLVFAFSHPLAIVRVFPPPPG